MLGNFTYCNPTKLIFGKGALDGLKAELEKFGKNVLLVYGGGSIKRNGIYDKVTAILRECGKNVAEDAGVMPNPTVEKLNEGVRARTGVRRRPHPCRRRRLGVRLRKGGVRLGVLRRGSVAEVFHPF